MTAPPIRGKLEPMRIILVALGAALLVLAGCSNGDDGASGVAEYFDGAPLEGGTDQAAVPGASAELGEDRTERVALDVDGVPDGAAPPTTLPAEPTPSFRESLQTGAFEADDVDCVVAKVIDDLGVSEAELDELVPSDAPGATVSDATQEAIDASRAAIEECLAVPVPAGPDGDRGEDPPTDRGADLVDQLVGLGMTGDEASCLSAVYLDSSVAPEDRDYLGCISIERIVELGS